MKKQKVLFLCVHNSARSQIAEAWLNYICGESFHASSAGLEPGAINPLVVQAMLEVGIDLSNKPTQAVSDVWKSGQVFQYIITVCDETSAQKCPFFPGLVQRMHWSFPDPSALTGTNEEKLERVRQLRDEIRLAIEAWCEEVCPGAFAPTAAR